MEVISLGVEKEVVLDLKRCPGSLSPQNHDIPDMGVCALLKANIWERNNQQLTAFTVHWLALVLRTGS